MSKVQQFALAGNIRVYDTYLRENNLKQSECKYLDSPEQTRGYEEIHIVRLWGWQMKNGLLWEVLDRVRNVNVTTKL